jgi:hypothetical protein
MRWPHSSSCPGLTRASTTFLARKMWMAGTSPAMTELDNSYDSLISNSRRSPFKSFFTALDATTSPSLA